MIRAELGRRYLNHGEPDKAAAELRIAERYDTDSDPQRARAWGEVYSLLNEVPSAVKYYEKYLAGARKVALPASQIERADQILTDLKSRLTPHAVTTALPHAFTPEELRAALKERLTSDEYQLVRIPFASTPKINEWAEQLVGDARDDMEKANCLFRGLIQRINLIHEVHWRTAEEAFTDWSDPKAAITCQDYTLMFRSKVTY